MTHVKAIFRHGVFEPLEPVNFREEQRVELSIESESDSPLAWLGKIQAMQAAVVRRGGVLPDSASEIAEDRRR